MTVKGGGRLPSATLASDNRSRCSSAGRFPACFKRTESLAERPSTQRGGGECGQGRRGVSLHTAGRRSQAAPPTRSVTVMIYDSTNVN